MLAGRLPFAGDSIAELYQLHVYEPVPDLSSLRPDVPPWLQHMIDRLLAKQSFERYQTAGETAADLERERVVAREVKPLLRRECLRCGAQTLEQVPVCLSCGFDAVDEGAYGDFDVSCAAEEDDARLEKFAGSVLGRTTRLQREGRPLLWTGIDAQTAQLIRSAAARHGINLFVRAHSPASDLKHAAALGFTAFLAVWILPLLAWFFLMTNVFALLTVCFWAGLVALAYRNAKRAEVRPVFQTLQFRERGLGADLWLQEIKPALTPKRSESMRLLVDAVVEKYLVVNAATASHDDGVQTELQNVLVEPPGWPKWRPKWSACCSCRGWRNSHSSMPRPHAASPSPTTANARGWRT